MVVVVFWNSGADGRKVTPSEVGSSRVALSQAITCHLTLELAHTVQNYSKALSIRTEKLWSSV